MTSTPANAPTNIQNKPRDEFGRFVSPDDIPRYRIDVWDISRGDVIKMLWEATERDRAEIEERYSDEPGIEIQVEDLS